MRIFVGNSAVDSKKCLILGGKIKDRLININYG